MKRIKFIIGGVLLTLIIAINVSFFMNTEAKSVSLISLFSVAHADDEGGGLLWEEQISSSTCQHEVTTCVYIWTGFMWIYSCATESFEGVWQNCIDGWDPFCSSGCVGAPA